jgi:polysaccharide biosynthesis transport protein
MSDDNKISLYERQQLAVERRGKKPAPPTVLPQRPPDLLGYLRVLRKRSGTIVTVIFIVFTIVTLATFKQKPVYEARTLIEIQKENPDIPTLQELFQIESVSDAYLETQNRILKSENLARRVIHQLNLDHLAEFAGEDGHQASHETRIPQAQFLPVKTEPSNNSSISDEVLKKFEGHLTVAPVKRSRLIEVTFESHDPALAAQILNTLAAAYIEQNLEARWDASQKASGWLSQQLVDMKVKLERSEGDLQGYARENGLLFLETEKGTSENIAAQRLRELQEELTKAQADRYQKQSLQSLLENNDPASLPGVFDNKLIQDLTEKVAELKREYSRLVATFNPEYPRVRELQNQIDESEAMLDSERQRAAHRIANEFRAAVQHESMLESAFNEQRREVNDVAEKSVQYNILKRDADTNKQLYVGLLEKLKETGVSTSLKATNIRIVDVAYPPKKFARPRTLLNLSMGLMLGICLGIAAAFLQEHLDNTLKNAEDVEQFLQVPALGSVPAIADPSQQNALHGLYAHARTLAGEERNKIAAPRWNRIEGNGHPNTALAEAFHGLRTSVLLSTAKRPPKSLLVTSAQPGEGKTTVAANLAMSLAQLGESVLLIDADLRRPSLEKFFANGSNAPGLVNFLTGNGDWRSSVWQAGASRLSVLFCGPVPPNPADLLSSEYMRTLLRDAAAEYKYVVLDSPPLLNLADSRVLATLVDGVILVVGGGSTPRELVHRAYISAVDAGSRVLGATINFADTKADYYYSAYRPEKNGKKENKKLG